MTYDSRSYELAEYFLADMEVAKVTEAMKDALAQTIQNAVEEWLWDREAAVIAEADRKRKEARP